MSVKATTVRLRATYVLYLLAIALTALNSRPAGNAVGDWSLAGLAILLVAAASLGRIWCSVFIAGRKDDELVSMGPYACCRHPLYALSMAAGAGFAIATHSVAIGMGLFVALLAMYRRAAVQEEAFLAERHGAQYLRYCAHTPRWWPRWRNYQLPSRLEVTPPLLWKSFLDAGANLLLVLALISAHRIAGATSIPGLFRLP
ncbi:MAG: isoprenylcysteine carboxylmethyltransferase family protein [Steroidobacteraceae bacterium]